MKNRIEPNELALLVVSGMVINRRRLSADIFCMAMGQGSVRPTMIQTILVPTPGATPVRESDRPPAVSGQMTVKQSHRSHWCAAIATKKSKQETNWVQRRKHQSSRNVGWRGGGASTADVEWVNRRVSCIDFSVKMELGAPSRHPNASLLGLEPRIFEPCSSRGTCT